MMGEDIKADGIRFVLDEEGYTDPIERLILARKIISYLSVASATEQSNSQTENTPHGQKNTDGLGSKFKRG